MILQRRGFTAGDTRLMRVNYDVFLSLTSTLVTATVTCPDASVVISGVVIYASSRKVQFFLAGGTAGTPFVVTIQVTDSDGQIVTDTIEFSVNAP